MQTWLTERWDLDVPVVGAPMAGAGGAALAAAVSGAGALGMIGIGHGVTGEQVLAQCGVVAATGRPYGVGLMAWALARDRAPLEAVLQARPALVSVSYGPYAEHVRELQAAGITVATQVGTSAEAREAEGAGVDVVVARGGEGGGHGRDDVSTLVLLQAVLGEVRTPVLAAGGVATARGLAAVLAMGAEGGWVGTAFLACSEAQTTPAARARLIQAQETDTAYGRVFDVGQRLAWPPEYGGRALRNEFFDRWAGREEELERDDDAVAELAAARAAGDLATGYVYAGQGAGLLSRERTAAEVVADLAGAADLLRRAAALTTPGPGRPGRPGLP